MTTIGNSAFNACSSLTSINIPESVTSIGSSAFCFCISLTSITIPNSVTSLGDRAFDSCGSSLTNVTLGNGISSIGAHTFYCCSGLTSITIPEGVTNIDIYAFYGCSGLTSITIPEGVTNIGKSAFKGCSSLDSIISLNTTPPTIYSSTFSDQYETATLYAASTDYATAEYWENFTNIVYDTSGNAIEDIAAEASTIRTVGNTIVITTETAQTAQIYSLAGQLIVKQVVTAGETCIGMPAGGVYVVALADGTRAKVIVK